MDCPVDSDLAMSELLVVCAHIHESTLGIFFSLQSLWLHARSLKPTVVGVFVLQSANSADEESGPPPLPSLFLNIYQPTTGPHPVLDKMRELHGTGLYRNGRPLMHQNPKPSKTLGLWILWSSLSIL